MLQVISSHGDSSLRLDYMCVIRLLTSDHFGKLEEATVPEIQRSNLSSVVLTMLNIGVSVVLYDH